MILSIKVEPDNQDSIEIKVNLGLDKPENIKIVRVLFALALDQALDRTDIEGRFIQEEWGAVSAMLKVIS